MNARGNDSVIAENRRARRDYEIEETLEAGLVLSGSEVKSLRTQQADLTQAHAGARGDDIVLFNADIPNYTHAAAGEEHRAKAARVLLVHKKEKARLLAAVQQKGMTLVPLKMYFTKRGRAKLLLGLGRGRKTRDKREVIKRRDWQRQKERLLRRNNR